MELICPWKKPIWVMWDEKGVGSCKEKYQLVQMNPLSISWWREGTGKRERGKQDLIFGGGWVKTAALLIWEVTKSEVCELDASEHLKLWNKIWVEWAEQRGPSIYCRGPCSHKMLYVCFLFWARIFDEVQLWFYSWQDLHKPLHSFHKLQPQ